MDAGEEVNYELEFCFLGLGRESTLDASNRFRGPEADEAGIVVGAPAAVECGEVYLLGG
jgi:hypothetical protein